MALKTFPKLSLFCLIVLIGFLVSLDAKNLGKLDCSENDGMKPDSTLLNLIISKCQPKKTDDEPTVAACLIKCLMKQQKALDKKGKLKLKKAAEIVDVFPEKFREQVTAKFEECAGEHNSVLKKESTGCASWLPFSNCFFAYSKDLCPTEAQRKLMTMAGNTTETVPAEIAATETAVTEIAATETAVTETVATETASEVA